METYIQDEQLFQRLDLILNKYVLFDENYY